jgi:hypothetical protein
MVWLLTVLVFVIAVAGMAVGVMVSGRRLQGSCGGESGACLCKPGSEPRSCPKKSAPPEATGGEVSAQRGLNVLNDEA